MGPVDAITQRLTGARVIEIKLKGEFAQAEDLLLAQAGVQRVERDGALLRVTIDSAMEDPGVLMEALIRGGGRIASFNEIQVDLEDIFMRITKGAVQ